MLKNRYAMNYANLALRAGFKVFVNLSLCDECPYIELIFSITQVNKVIYRGCCII